MEFLFLFVGDLSTELIVPCTVILNYLINKLFQNIQKTFKNLE